MKATTGSKAFQPGEPLLNWLAEAYPEKANEFAKTFDSKTYTREELILACENDKDMGSELVARVIAKWEAIEAEAKEVAVGGRKPKFG